LTATGSSNCHYDNVDSRVGGVGTKCLLICHRRGRRRAGTSAALPPRTVRAGPVARLCHRAYAEAERRGAGGRRARPQRRAPAGRPARELLRRQRETIDLGLNLPAAGFADRCRRLPALAQGPLLARSFARMPQPQHVAAGVAWLARLGSGAGRQTFLTVRQHALLVAFMAAAAGQPGPGLPHTFPQ
jgi:hypothetical protein